MSSEAWKNQSESLVEVQKKGTGLETEVRKILGWDKGNVIYDREHGYKLQCDAAFPSIAHPEIIVSVTYTDPDTRGHSNENKFQLKVGELVLLKCAYPGMRMVLVLGGSGEAWLSYVLNAFQIFFDEVICLWDEAGRKRLLQIARENKTVFAKHEAFWTAVRVARASRQLSPVSSMVPCGSVRYAVMDKLKAQSPIVYNPSLIENEVAQLCMRRSYDLEGAEWRNYLHENWGAIEMSRNYFNPLEATIELSLTRANLRFQGGIARDIQVPSLLHDLGMPETKVSEDFVLHSKLLNQPVYIQCKASGGGRTQHGKNIQNRTKEQTTRGILYTCSSPDKRTLLWKQQNFHWVSVVDGDWGVTRKERLKYVHMLELAGYDRIICAADLLTTDLRVKGPEDNLLTRYLIDTLDCEAL